MTGLFQKLHAKMGDLWWYTLLIFAAQRSGDLIQAFIGLWLVPKYVGPAELGAVLPLQQLAALFAVPLAILATVFAKFVNTYATRGEFGKVKSFIHDVLGASIGLFVLCIAVAYLVVPYFYERLNIVSGSLTILILLAGFCGNLSSLFSAALQGLKKFKTMTVQSIISAPIRLVTLLVAMPIRALSGYILGQATPPACCAALAAGSLRRDLKGVTRDTSWRRDLPEIGRYLVPVAINTALGTLLGAVSTTIYRQRLPEVESAAYYLLTRFTEISAYIGFSMLVILTPLASEAHERGVEDKRILRQTLVGTSVSSLVFAVALTLFGKWILELSPLWSVYTDYAYLFPWLTLSTGTSLFIGTIVTYEMACRRFRPVAISLTATFVWTAFMVITTGVGIFEGLLPSSFIATVRSWHMDSLRNLTFGSLICNLLQIAWILLAQRLNRASGVSKASSRRR